MLVAPSISTTFSFSDNPHATFEQKMNCRSIPRWAAVSFKFGRGFKMIDSTMNGEEYLSISQTLVFPLLGDCPHGNTSAFFK